MTILEIENGILEGVARTFFANDLSQVPPSLLPFPCPSLDGTFMDVPIATPAGYLELSKVFAQQLVEANQRPLIQIWQEYIVERGMANWLTAPVVNPQMPFEFGERLALQSIEPGPEFPWKVPRRFVGFGFMHMYL